MLSDASIAYLKPLKHRPDAERKSCVLPLGGIYWDDEIPNFRDLLKVADHDRNLILRLFSIRFRIWDAQPLSQSDTEFWETARSQVPEYPLFQRLELSEEDRLAQEQVERDAIEGFEALFGVFGDADKVEIHENEHGFQSFSATFDLTKDRGEPPKASPWWKRLLGWK
jgi:hypothetical protein